MVSQPNSTSQLRATAAAFESLPRAMAWVSVDGRILATTRSWLRRRGLSRPALGDHLSQHVPGAAEALSDAVLLQLPVEHRSPLGTHLLTPLVDDRERPIGVLEELVDAPEHPADELERLRSENRALRDRLEQVPRVAHDLNNLLTAMLTRSERSPAPALAASVHHAAELVCRLTDTPGRSRWVAVDGTLRSLAHTLSGLAGPQVEVRFALGAPHARVRAVPSDLVQIVVNLVANACAAMPEGGVVTVSSALDGGRAPGGQTLTLAVGDTGQGMTPEVRRRLFEPYFTTKAEGGGIGLSIVADVVARLGGVVDVSSRAGGGSLFEVHLPTGA